MKNRTLVLFDEGITPGIVDQIESGVPTGWVLEKTINKAEIIITSSQDITGDILSKAGPDLGLIIKLVPGSATIAKTKAKIVEVGEPALFGVAEHAVTLMLALSRHLLYVVKQTNAQKWVPGIRNPHSN